jgi:alkylation response protein AidB-like acyl-CoA dehydrogenase
MGRGPAAFDRRLDARENGRAVDLRFSTDEEAFRAGLRAWLAANQPSDPGEHATLADEVAFLRAWQRTLAQAGWVGIHWPRAYGGRGASVIENYLFQEEMAAARAPEIIGRIGVNLVGPTLIAHGTEEQKRRFLPPIMPAEEIWCQLFSEPGAGSDLTALRTRAEKAGGTERAEGGRWRSPPAASAGADGPSAPKSKGISFSAIWQPGVTVRSPARHGGDQ